MKERGNNRLRDETASLLLAMYGPSLETDSNRQTEKAFESSENLLMTHFILTNFKAKGIDGIVVL